MELNESQRSSFLEVLWDFYARKGRDLPWRHAEANGSFDPYKIMVSELMLQQTQVARVIPKYYDFLARYPTASTLAEAELGDVLREWQGLGYNRRAKFLWQAAKRITHELGSFPATLEGLVTLSGIGRNTAGAILAYAYNQPSVFVETNVRSVYIHHFFSDQDVVTDREIIAVLERTLDRENPREFYWALMDYGSYLKATVGNPNRVSKHYAKQSAFHGSRRQVRGQVIRLLGAGSRTIAELRLDITDTRLEHVLAELVAEGMIRVNDGAYAL